MTKQNILILGNKQYYNFKLDTIIDSFDVIYRLNLAPPNMNNGTKFGKLAMCGHVYQNFVSSPLSKTRIIEIYHPEYTTEFLSDYCDFFEKNKEKFDEIFHQNEHNWQQWNSMLEEYNSPHKFSKMATTGYSTIFKNLQQGSGKIYVFGFSLCDDDNSDVFGQGSLKSIKQEQGYHSYSNERKILAWLHNNKKIDASLCMLEDTKNPSLKDNVYGTVPSHHILNLIDRNLHENTR